MNGVPHFTHTGQTVNAAVTPGRNAGAVNHEERRAVDRLQACPARIPIN
jgi:hypothetical protein